MAGPRQQHTATLLSNGQLLVTGGFDFGVATELSSAELFSSFVDFAAFMARGEVRRGPSANDDEFEVKATLTLGAGSNGISPVGEEVSLQVGTFSTAIPAGSFDEDAEGRFEFEGVVAGVTLRMKIRPSGGKSFAFEAHGEGADLTGTLNPVTVRLSVGDDRGSTGITAEIR